MSGMADGRLWMLECDAPTCGSQRSCATPWASWSGDAPTCGSQLTVTTDREGHVTGVHGMGVDQPTCRRRLVRGIRDVYRLARNRGWQVSERPGRLPPRVLCPCHDSLIPSTGQMGAGL
ncbi:hypothetical protein [Bifidobacterium rousetti]|uniref:hypothetical protein n=1 Tax=Bifidobacterium rousetti TaxID=2045439 RepID=UPI0012387514|nr:hypothetical protein [Bifidobacterium rousetti]